MDIWFEDKNAGLQVGKNNLGDLFLRDNVIDIIIPDTYANRSLIIKEYFELTDITKKSGIINYTERKIEFANKQTKLCKNHSLMGAGNGRTNYIIGDLINLSMEEAKTALSLGIKIGYSNLHEEHHGTWEDYYSYNSLSTDKQINEFYKETNLSSLRSISIEPAYKLANTILTPQELKHIVQKYLSESLIDDKELKKKQEHNIINDLKKNHIKPTRTLVNNIMTLNSMTKKDSDIKNIMTSEQEGPGKEIQKSIRNQINKQIRECELSL